MSLSNTLGAYADIEQLFQGVLAHGPAVVRLGTRAQAVRFRQRAYHYRTLLRQTPSSRGASPFDHLVVRIPDTDPCAVRVEPQANLTLGNVTFDNPSATLPPAESFVRPDVPPAAGLLDDPLIEDAAEIARKLGYV